MCVFNCADDGKSPTKCLGFEQNDLIERNDNYLYFLYESEALSLTPRKEHRWRMFEKGVMRKYL